MQKFVRFETVTLALLVAFAAIAALPLVLESSGVAFAPHARWLVLALLFGVVLAIRQALYRTSPVTGRSDGRA